MKGSKKKSYTRKLDKMAGTKVEILDLTTSNGTNKHNIRKLRSRTPFYADCAGL